MSIIARARPEIQALKPYSSARMEASTGQVFLNANESPWPSAADSVGELNRYPDPQPAKLRDALAGLYGVEPARVLVGRGSDEAIDLLTRAFVRPGIDEVIISPPTFGMYQVSADIQGARVIRVPLRADAGFAYPFEAVRAAAGEATRLIYVCTPNNPTGDVVPREHILALADALRDRAIVVVDEAYVEYADTPSLAADVAGRDNLAVLRTLSKAHGLAGARIGTLIADPAVIALCRKLMAPYPLPTPCVTAALRALTAASLAATAERVAATVAERARLAARLAALPRVRGIYRSQANFLTVRVDSPRALHAELLKRGIVVRDVSHQPDLADALRITVGTRAENDALLKALADLAEAA